MRVAIVSKALVRASYRAKLDALTALGVEVHAIVPHRFGGEALEPRTDGPFRLLERHLFFHRSHHVSFYRGLARTLRDIGPDVIHLDEEPFNLVAYQGLLASPTPRLTFFTWQNLDKWYPPPFSFFRHRVLRAARCAIAGSEGAATVLRDAGFARAIHVIPQFGVDPAVYRPVPRTDRPVTIGYLGRLVPEKGLDLLLDAARGLPVRVLVCGNGPERDALRGQADRAGVPLTLRPHVPTRDVPSVLNTLDVLVLPSRTTAHWVEQFGRVLIEAMSCQVAVVGSSSGEIPRVIGDAGLVFPEADAGAFRTALTRLSQDESLRLELGRRGRQRVLEHFTQQQIAEQTYAVYRSMMA